MRGLALLLGLALVAGSVRAQETSPLALPPIPEPTSEVLLVGVFHFAQTDTTEFDVLDARRQAEVAEVTAALGAFEPTKVMVEWKPYFRQRFVDSTYAAYRAGAFELGRNEVYQLGYRLADAANLDRVWAVDHAGLWLGDSLLAVARARGQMDLVTGTAPGVLRRPWEVVSRDSVFASRATVGDVLAWMSSDAYQRRMWDGYVNRMARVGIAPGDDFDTEENEIGAEALAEWVRRNIKIYRHMLARMADGDRVVLFIGADHVAPIRELFEANHTVRVATVADYL